MHIGKEIRLQPDLVRILEVGVLDLQECSLEFFDILLLDLLTDG